MIFENFGNDNKMQKMFDNFKQISKNTHKNQSNIMVTTNATALTTTTTTKRTKRRIYNNKQTSETQTISAQRTPRSTSRGDSTKCSKVLNQQHSKSKQPSSSKMLSFALVLSICVQMAHTRSTVQTFPVSAAASPISPSSSTLSVQAFNAAADAADINAMTTTQMRQKLTIETNSIQRHLAEGTTSSAIVNSNSNSNNKSPADHTQNRSLKRVFLSNRNVTCNDGSQAGFYLRKNPTSKKWIVFLEGGWHCYDIRSCKARWLRLRHLMTSAQWPETRDVGGILSPLPDENPYWHNANHVLVPYCSSDSWSGTRAEPESKDSWRFMGALILRQVIADLIPLGLERPNGAELLLVGSSAGGLGVMLNLDRITNYLVNERNLLVTVRGISDSGWFLDREPYTPSAVASSDAVRQGWKLWQGSLPDECTKQHANEPWRCYFGYRLYPTLKSPLFVFQWLFDEAQMRADNVGAPVTPQQWNYIHEMGGALRSSLDNVTAVFAPSCIGHAVLSKRDWVNIKIDDISLPAALRCWEHSTRPRRKRHDKLKRATESTLLSAADRRRRNQRNGGRKHNKKQQQQTHLSKANGNDHGSSNVSINESNNSSNDASIVRNQAKRKHLTKAQREERKRRRHERRQQRRRENRNRNRNRNRKRHPNLDAPHRNNHNNMADDESKNEAHPDNETALPQRRHKGRHHSNNSDNDSDIANTVQYHYQHQRNHHSDKQQQQRRRKQPQHQSQADQHNAKRAEQQQSTNNSNNSNNNEQLSIEQQFEEKERLADEPALHRQHDSNDAKSKRRNRLPRVPEKCALRLLERCSWPQCNHSCPTLTNPLTGEEMRFLELLTSFGLDIEAVAAALGVDMHTLNNMDRTELVNLLTQQVS